MMPDFLKIVALGALLALSSKPVMASDQRTVAPVFDCWEPERPFKQCAATGSDGRPRLKRAYLARLRYRPDGLAAVLLLGGTGTRKSQWFYVRRGVIPMPVETMDNGPDYFKDGLARSRVGAKIGVHRPQIQSRDPSDVRRCLSIRRWSCCRLHGLPDCLRR